MNRNTKLMLAALAAAFAAACATTQLAEPLRSLRGSDAAAADRPFAEAVWMGREPGVQQGYMRTYSTQPPLIPHETGNFDDLTLTDNPCLGCHVPGNTGVPPIGERHFLAGSRTQLAPNRYACLMCHVPQSDAKPLVDNTFQGDRLVPAARKP